MFRRLRGRAVRNMGVGIDSSLVNEIIRRIRTVACPDRIILFGSVVSGQMNADSDVDLLVLERDPGNTREASVRISDALRGLGYPFDIIVMATERYEESKDVIGGIAYPVKRTGRVIYAAS